jgi:signal transduction histidine kinase
MVLSLVLFTVVAGAIAWLVEDPHDVTDAESESEELVEHLIIAIGIAGPLGIVTTMLAGRWLTRRATARIDAVVSAAAKVSSRDLSARLPVTDAGDELDDLSVALNRMLARIDTGIAAQRQFAADASHELRTPLTAVRSTLEVARTQRRTVEDWEQTVDLALVELVRMSALVDGLLQLARADIAGPRALVTIGEVIDNVCEELDAQAVARRVSIQATAATDAVVMGDSVGIAIAVRNLVANAINHSPSGGVVTIRAARHDGVVAVEVRDQGIGVRPEQRDRIFEPFARGDGVPADRVVSGAGVGLGLAIARRIATAHDGRIDLDDSPDGGARFTLVLAAPAVMIT